MIISDDNVRVFTLNVVAELIIIINLLQPEITIKIDYTLNIFNH